MLITLWDDSPESVLFAKTSILPLAVKELRCPFWCHFLWCWITVLRLYSCAIRYVPMRRLVLSMALLLICHIQLSFCICLTCITLYLAHLTKMLLFVSMIINHYYDSQNQISSLLICKYYITRKNRCFFLTLCF